MSNQIQKSLTEQIKLSTLKNSSETLNEKYGETFQTNLFRCFITDVRFWKKRYGQLNVNLFSKFHGDIFKTFVEYFEKYNNLPSKDVTITLIRENQLLPENKDFIVNIINDIFNISDKTNQLQYYKDATKEFITNKNVMEALVDSMDLFSVGKYKEIADIIAEAVKESDIDENLGIDFLNSAELLDGQLKVETIETPFAGINEILHGGLGRKELGLILGGTGAGKSWIMQTIASHALLKDFNVLYYTLEMSDVSVATRFASIIQEKNPDDVVGADILEIKNTLKSKGLGSRLFIVEFPTNGADILTIRNNISSLYNYYSFKPDLICVDYADLMRPKTTYSEKRHELSSIYGDLRRMAGELNAGVWSISQVNRSGFDKRIITVDNIAEDFNKATICDFIMSVGRNVKDRQGGTAQAFIAKNRRGKDAIEFDMNMKFDKGKITIDKDAHEILNANMFKEKRPDVTDDEVINNLMNSLL